MLSDAETDKSNIATKVTLKTKTVKYLNERGFVCPAGAPLQESYIDQRSQGGSRSGIF